MEVCYFSPNLIDVKEWVVATVVFILDQSHGVVTITPCCAASKVISTCQRNCLISLKFLLISQIAFYDLQLRISIDIPRPSVICYFYIKFHGMGTIREKCLKRFVF